MSKIVAADRFSVNTIPSKRNRKSNSATSSCPRSKSIALGKRLNIDPFVVEQALDNVANGVAVFFVISGKIASGKDTVGDIVSHSVKTKGFQRVAYAEALRKDIDRMLTDLREKPFLSVPDYLSIEWPDIEVKHFSTFKRLLNFLRNEPEITSYSRTAEVREIIQYHGSEVRRAQDMNYWVDKTLYSVVKILAEEKSVYITDARFPNEITAAQEVGAFVVRLQVSEDEQLRRLLARDGANAGINRLNHMSDVALDDYLEYDMVVDTTRLLPEECASLIVETFNTNRNSIKKGRKL